MNLSETLQMDFKALSKAYEERFSPANQTQLYRAQIWERRQKASETKPRLGQDVRRLAQLAYTTDPVDVCEILAKEYYSVSLTSADMRLRIKNTRPPDLIDAIRYAVELNAFCGAERKSIWRLRGWISKRSLGSNCVLTKAYKIRKNCRLDEGNIS